MPKFICITGTDTGVGKTVATAALATLCAQQNASTVVIKPVQTGISEEGITDISQVEALVASPLVSCVQLWGFALPLAPKHAALLEEPKRELPSLAALVERIALVEADLVLIEGAGGALVELTSDGKNILDLACALHASVVVVTRPDLGTLNHTQLTLLAVREWGCPLAGLIIGMVPREVSLVQKLNIDQLSTMKDVPYWGALPQGMIHLSKAEFERTASAHLVGFM